MTYFIGYDDNCPSPYTPRHEERFDGPYTDSAAAWRAYEGATDADCRSYYGLPTDPVRFGWCVTLYTGGEDRHVLSCRTIVESERVA